MVGCVASFKKKILPPLSEVLLMCERKNKKIYDYRPSYADWIDFSPGFI